MDAINDLVVNIVKELGKRNKFLGIFLDLSKTFSTVHISTLLLKLEKSGIRGLVLETFQDYLTNQNQCVKIDSQTIDADLTT